MGPSLPWYFSMYLHTLVPAWVFVAITITCIVGICVRWRWRYAVLLAGYCSFVLCHAVIFRNTGIDEHIKLMPFWEYSEVLNGNLELFGEVVMNVLLFVPIGMLAAMAYKTHPKRWIKTTGFAMCFSLAIELLQLITCRGLCETDDAIHNTLGAIIGNSIAIGVEHIVKRTIQCFKSKT